MTQEQHKYEVAARNADDEHTAVTISIDPHFAAYTSCDPNQQRSFVVTNKMFEAFEDDLNNSKTEDECRHAVDEFVRRAEALEAA